MLVDAVEPTTGAADGRPNDPMRRDGAGGRRDQWWRVESGAHRGGWVESREWSTKSNNTHHHNNVGLPWFSEVVNEIARAGHRVHRPTVGVR
jgi:hypothetical protein